MLVLGLGSVEGQSKCDHGLRSPHLLLARPFASDQVNSLLSLSRVTHRLLTHHEAQRARPWPVQSAATPHGQRSRMCTSPSIRRTHCGLSAQETDDVCHPHLLAGNGWLASHARFPRERTNDVLKWGCVFTAGYEPKKDPAAADPELHVVHVRHHPRPCRTLPRRMGCPRRPRRTG
jgi:hypothetical protein